jgi:hypothetical protein
MNKSNCTNNEVYSEDGEYIKFISYSKGASEIYPESKVEVTIAIDSTLTEVLQKFEDFLKGSGYVFDGYLDIVNDYYLDDYHD